MSDLLTGSPCGKSEARFFSLLVFLICLLFFFPPPWETKAISVFISAIWVLGLGLWSLRALKPRMPDTPVFLGPLGAWILLLGVSAFFSGRTAAGLANVVLEIAYALLFLASYLSGRNPGQTRRSLAWLAGAGLVLALYGCYQHAHGLQATYQHFFSGRQPNGPEETELAGRLLSGRAFALFIYPNLFAGFLAMLLPVGLALLYTAQNRLARWFWGLLLLGFAAGFYAAGSVAGWAAAGCGGFLFFLLIRKPLESRLGRYQWLAWLALAVSAIGLEIAILQARGFHAFLAQIPGRWSLWTMAWHMACDHWLLGVGPASFGAFVPRALAASGQYARFAHNLWLQQLAETGWFGGLAFLALVISLLFTVAKRWSALGDNFPRILAAGLAAGAAAGLLHACLDLDLQFLKTSILFWFLCGTLLGMTAPPDPERPVANFASVPEAGTFWLRAGLCLLAVAMLWRGGRSHPVEALLYAGTGFLIFLFFQKRKECGQRWQDLAAAIPLFWPLAALFSWGVFSAMVSENPGAAIPGLSLVMAGLLLYFIAWLTPGVGRDLLRTLSLSSALLAGAALVEALGHQGIRVTAGWPNPNLLAAFFSMGLLVNLAFFLQPGKPVFLNWKYGLSSLLLFLALLATGSIAGLASVAGGMLLLFAWHARQGRRRFLAGMAGSVLCLVLLVLLLPLSTGQRLREIRNYGSPAQERLGMAQAALSMAKDRPVAGIGPGNFEKAFDRYKFPNVRGLSHYGKTTDFAHNEILQILAVLGIPGLLLLVWLLAATGRSFSAFWRNKIPDPVRLGCWAALAGSSVQALADFNWHLPGLWVWGLLLLAVAQSPQPPAVAPAAVPAEPRLRYRGGASLFLLGLLVLAACLAAWRPLLSAYYQKLGEAQRYKQNLPAAAAEFTTALEFYPFASEAYDHLGQVHADLYATTGAENEFRLAEWAFQKAQSQDRLDAFVHRHLGMLYAMKGGRLSDTERWRFLTLAEEQYRLAVQRAPTNAMIFFEMGNLLRDAGRLSQAESAWREAVQLEPNYAAAWSNLGVAMELRDNNTDAEACLRRALTLRALVPQVEGKYEIELLSLDWSVVHYNLGHLMEHNGRWSEAREEYLAVLEMEPNNRQVRQRVKALEKIVP